MAEYIEREAFLDYMKGTSRYFNVKFDIENFPAADVAPVVRCKGCKHYLGLAECEFVGHFSGGTDYFCADGERKTT